VDGTGGSLTAITLDGAELDGDLARPDGPMRAIVVICHPHPDYGGDRFNIVVDTLFRTLPRHGFAAARFDFRRPVAGRGEQAELDVRATISAAAAAAPDDIVVLAGYSFGAGVGLSVAAGMAEVAAIVAIAPPAPMIPLDVVPQVSTLAIVPAHDQFGPPEAIAPIVAGWPRGSMVTVESADHFLAGHTQHVADTTIAWLDTVLPIEG
jgi:alpha/beta superfamily hydrolase